MKEKNLPLVLMIPKRMHQAVGALQSMIEHKVSLVHDLFGIAAGSNSPLVDDNDPAAGLKDKLKIMRKYQHGAGAFIDEREEKEKGAAHQKWKPQPLEHYPRREARGEAVKKYYRQGTCCGMKLSQ